MTAAFDRVAQFTGHEPATVRYPDGTSVVTEALWRRDVKRDSGVKLEARIHLSAGPLPSEPPVGTVVERGDGTLWPSNEVHVHMRDADGKANRYLLVVKSRDAVTAGESVTLTFESGTAAKGASGHQTLTYAVEATETGSFTPHKADRSDERGERGLRWSYRAVYAGPYRPTLNDRLVVDGNPYQIDEADQDGATVTLTVSKWRD